MQGGSESAFQPRPCLTVGVWERKLPVLRTDEAPASTLGSGIPTSPLALIRPLSPPISGPQQICFSDSLQLQGEAESLEQSAPTRRALDHGGWDPQVAVQPWIPTARIRLLSLLVFVFVLQSR